MEVTKTKRKAVDTLTMWLQCFGLFVAVLAKKYPETVPDMMVYMILIIHTHRDYEDPVWRKYDKAFRDKAAVTSNRNWATLDPDLYSRICSGRAKAVLPKPIQASTAGGNGDPQACLQTVRRLTRESRKQPPPQGKRPNVCYD